MRIKRRACWPLAIFTSLVLLAACSKDPFRDQINDHPRRFELNGKGYILSEQEPGVIRDDIALYTADAGARTFNYNDKEVLTQLYVGNCEKFASLSPKRYSEIDNLAKAAIEFIREHKTKHRYVSEIDKQNVEIFSTFRKNKFADKKPSPSFSGEKRVFKIPSWRKLIPSLLIDVPPGFKLSEHKGPDFYVYYLNSQSKNWTAGMGMYIGNNPQRPWPETSSQQPGMAGSFQFVWQVWSEKNKGKVIYHRDAIIEDYFACSSQIKEAPRKHSLPYDHKLAWHSNLPEPPPPNQLVGLVIHIFVSGTDLGAVNAMSDWIGTLRKQD